MLALYVVFIGILLRVMSWLYFARHKVEFHGGIDPSLELAWDKHFIPYLIYFPVVDLPSSQNLPTQKKRLKHPVKLS